EEGKPMSRIRNRLTLAVIVSLSLPAMAVADLVHRYDFNGEVNDLVGAANGTLIDPKNIATYSGGLLNLPNAGANSNQATFSTGAYVALPAGIITSLGNQATFETWINMNTNRNWAEIWSFGKSDTGAGQATGAPNSRYITLIPQNGANQKLRLTH